MYLQLSQVNEIAVDRLVLAKGQPTEIQLHGFCYSSDKAYGAFLYLRSVNQQREVTTKLLCSKYSGPSEESHTPKVRILWSLTPSTFDTENSTCIEFED